jgi:hypothetical protein
MRTRVVKFSEIAKTPGLVLTAERYLCTDEERRKALLVNLDVQIGALQTRRDAIAAADGAEVRRLYAAKFWHLRGRSG